MAAIVATIVTPSYNQAPYIRQTIRSVLEQRCPAVEHIVVDGGSNDGTVDILREYGSQFPDRFRWVSEPDHGQAHAFNKGLAMARGEYIGWQNSDDYYLPEAFTVPIAYLVDHPEVLAVYSGCELVNQHGIHMALAPIGPFEYRRLLMHCCISNQSAFIRKDVLLACGGLDLDLHYALDYDLWLRLGLLGPLVYLPGIRGAFRHLPDAKSAAGFARMAQETFEVVERVSADPALPIELRPTAEVALQRHRLVAVLAALVAKQRARATDLLRDALTVEPTLATRRGPGNSGYRSGSILKRKARSKFEPAYHLRPCTDLRAVP